MIRKNINEYLIIKDNKVVVDIYNSIEQIDTETVSGDIDTLTIADGSIILKDVNGNVINTVPTPATAIIEETIPDGKVTLNGNAFLSISPNELENITLEDEEGNSVTPIGNVGSTIILPNEGEWQRPTDWLPIPTIAPTEQVFYGLCTVYQDRSNLVSLRMTGNYTVDWGDGVIENFASDVVAHHQYSWSSVGNVTSDGFRQALIKVTPQSGQNLTGINLQFKHPSMGGGNGKSSIFVDMVMNLPQLVGSGTPIVLGQLNGGIIHSSCQRVRIDSIGNCNTLTYLCFSFYELRKFEIGDTTNVINMANMFQRCYSITSIPLFNTQNVTNMSNMLYGCSYLVTIPLFNTINVTNMSNMLQNCYSLTTVPILNTQNVTNMYQMFINCYVLVTVPLFNTINVTNMYQMYYNCYLLTSANLAPMASVTNTAQMFFGVTNIQHLILTGCRYGLDILNNEMSATALNDLFTSLGTAVGSQTITITGNPGASTCDTTIATAKGFTVLI